MKHLSFTAMALFALMPTALAALQAGLERTAVQEGETVQLILESDGMSAQSVDLSPLEKDFDIVGRSQSSSMRIVNGARSSSTQWQLTLSPKRTGVLEIPPLTNGSDTTPVLKVEVKPAGAATPGDGGQPPELFLEVEATPTAPYVQQQVNYTVRIFQGVDLREMSMSELKPGSAAVEVLGQPVVYDAERHGRRYRVTEKRYALFPQASGALQLPGPLFRGGIPERSRRLLPNDLLGGGLIEQFLATTRQVNLRGKEVNLEVRPAPASSGAWLPAKSVRLSESWSPDPPVFKVGEPVTRTLTISALGATPSQLPELTEAALPQMHSYPDQPQLESQVAANDVLGIRRQKYALVPAAEGSLTLPEIRLPWWDTTTDQPQVAVLPARTITVLPGSAPAKPPAVSQPVAASQPLPAPQPAPAPPLPSPPAAPPSSSDGGGLFWVALLVVGWVATAGAWFLDRRRRAPAAVLPAPADAPSAVSQGALAKGLQEPCQRHDPRATRDLLLAWAAGRWPQDPPRSLTRLAARITDPAAREALEGLDRALYGQTSGSWQGEGFPETVLPALEASASEAASSPRGGLPPLHPA